MQGKKTFLALSTAFAALFVGCEWTGSSDSDSWSGSYDAMNFSGTYRAVTTTSSLSVQNTAVTNSTADTIYSKSEDDWTFNAGSKVASGMTSKGNIVPGSFQASVGEYVWNDNGSGSLVFTNPNSGASTATEDSIEHVVEPYKVGTYPGTQPYKLKGNNIVKGSVQISVGSFSFSDESGTLKQIGGGSTATASIDYEAGNVQFSFDGIPPNNVSIIAGYKWIEKKGTEEDSENLSGTGTIQYQSGSWTLQIKPAMKTSQTIVIRYSYNEENSKTEQVSTGLKTTTGNKVTSLTVTQSGQNLTITLNNGIVMSGKFTNVQQTGKINEDTNEGYNTYNAQFQVQTTDNKMVGSLNYDLSNGYRMMNGTWTWGKSSYDVQAVGPSWKNSADSSTLSVGSITK